MVPASVVDYENGVFGVLGDDGDHGKSMRPLLSGKNHDVAASYVHICAGV